MVQTPNAPSQEAKPRRALPKAARGVFGRSTTVGCPKGPRQALSKVPLSTPGPVWVPTGRAPRAGPASAVLNIIDSLLGVLDVAETRGSGGPRDDEVRELEDLLLELLRDSGLGEEAVIRRAEAGEAARQLEVFLAEASEKFRI